MPCTTVSSIGLPELRHCKRHFQTDPDVKFRKPNCCCAAAPDGGKHVELKKTGVNEVSLSGAWFTLCSDRQFEHTVLGLDLPDITGRKALAVRPDVVNAKYHVITNATYNCDPIPAKFKHVTNIETCTLLCCDYSTLWEALHANMVEIGARCSDKNVKILGRYQWIG